MKLLVTAYTCSPKLGSEAGNAWYWITNCAKSYDVTVVTPESMRADIEAALTNQSSMRLKFVYTSWPKRVSASGVEYTCERFKVYLWECLTIFKVLRLSKREKFDLCQHTSIATWRTPSSLAFTNIPFIFGPVSGSEKIPSGMRKHLSLSGRFWARLRDLLIRVAACDPLIRFTLKRADTILVSSPLTLEYLKAKYGSKVIFYGHAFQSIPFAEIHGVVPPRHERNERGIRLAWMGRLIPRKALDLLLYALCDPRLSQCKLDVMGDGPERRRCMKIVRELNIAKKVWFLGELNRVEVLSRLSEYDVFVFTSLQDMMGQALSEAMQLGLPCVVMDWGGPAALVGEDGAAKVPVSTFEGTTMSLADVLSRVCSDADLRCTLSQNARRRIMHLTDQVRLDRKRDEIFGNVLTMMSENIGCLND